MQWEPADLNRRPHGLEMPAKGAMTKAEVVKKPEVRSQKSREVRGPAPRQNCRHAKTGAKARGLRTQLAKTQLKDRAKAKGRSSERSRGRTRCWWTSWTIAYGALFDGCALVTPIRRAGRDAVGTDEKAVPQRWRCSLTRPTLRARRAGTAGDRKALEETNASRGPHGKRSRREAIDLSGHSQGRPVCLTVCGRIISPSTSRGQSAR